MSGASDSSKYIDLNWSLEAGASHVFWRLQRTLHQTPHFPKARHKHNQNHQKRRVRSCTQTFADW